MMLLRGKGRGLEIACGDRALGDVCADLREQLAERPDFYRGSRARAVFTGAIPDEAELAPLRDLLAEYEIALDELALGVPSEARPPRDGCGSRVVLSDSARSLVADFAGARADLAQRRLARTRGAAAPYGGVRSADGRSALPPPGSTLYHRGTLRGGQTLHHMGNIVVLGDVNPGAELVATGDIVVFGALRGVAHAGAQGDESARVVALELAPTQLRIATLIAAGESDRTSGRAGRRGAEHAIVQGGRIVIISHESAESIRREVVN